MKRLLPCLVLAFATFAFASEAQPSRELRPLMQQPLAAHLTARVLSQYHYKTVPLDDALSEKIFDHYLKALDSDRLFFLQADIDQLAGARTRLDDAILDEDLSLPFAIFNTYVRRAGERFAYARSLLKQGFDSARPRAIASSGRRSPGRKPRRRSGSCGASGSRTTG